MIVPFLLYAALAISAQFCDENGCQTLKNEDDYNFDGFIDDEKFYLFEEYGPKTTGRGEKEPVFAKECFDYSNREEKCTISTDVFDIMARKYFETLLGDFSKAYKSGCTVDQELLQDLQISEIGVRRQEKVRRCIDKRNEEAAFPKRK